MKYDVVIIGGNPAGGSAAAAVKKLYKEKSVLVIRKEEKSLIPCGIPYTFGTLNSVEDNIKSIEPAKEKGIEFLIEEVVSVHSENKFVVLKNQNKVQYEKLIFATGSTPFIPPIEGRDLKGVVSIRKELEYIKSINEPLKKAKNVVVVGAGFIGLEMSDELAKGSGNVTLIESMDSILPLAFDKEMVSPVHDILVKHGVNVITGAKVDKISGKNGSVESVKLIDGRNIPADMVILAIGYRPNTIMAKESGIEIGTFGGIITDEYLRTNIKDIFAVGDCVEHRDYFTRKPSRLMLASTGASEARIAGMNLFDLRVVRQSKGSIAIFSTSVDDISMGAAGLTEKQAVDEGFHIITGKNKGVDHHPAKLPGTLKQTIKLVFSRGSGVILGAQITGGNSTGEMINILGLAIQKHMTASELATIQYGTQPMLTAGPAVYPVAMAAMDALEQMCRME